MQLFVLKQLRPTVVLNVTICAWWRCEPSDRQTLLSAAVCLSDSKQLDVDSLQSIPEPPSAAETSSGNPERVAREPGTAGRGSEKYALLKGLCKRIHEVRTHL